VAAGLECTLIFCATNWVYQFRELTVSLWDECLRLCGASTWVSSGFWGFRSFLILVMGVVFLYYYS